MPPTILCLDDVSSLVTLVAHYLRELTPNVITATDPDDALAVMLGRDIAVVIADFEMPKMNGVEFLVRSRRIQPETTRILLTSHRTVDTALAGINEGEVFRFLSKPLDGPSIRQAAIEALAHYENSALAQRERRLASRRAAMLDALESDHPSISRVDRDDEGRYQIGPALDLKDAEGIASLATLAIP
jgi:DNA-binding NtrC family response regulator